MKISFVSLENIRCFNGLNRIEVSPNINLFVGPNNSGKSTILKSIYNLQGYRFNYNDISIEQEGKVEVQIGLRPLNGEYKINGSKFISSNYEEIYISFSLSNTPTYIGTHEVWTPKTDLGVFIDYLNEETKNIIYPFFSNRKVDSYSRSIANSEAKKNNWNFR